MNTIVIYGHESTFPNDFSKEIILSDPDFEKLDIKSLVINKKNNTCSDADIDKLQKSDFVIFLVNPLELNSLILMGDVFDKIRNLPTWNIYTYISSKDDEKDMNIPFESTKVIQGDEDSIQKVRDTLLNYFTG